MRRGSVMAGPWEALGPDRLELGEGARIFSGRLHYVDLLQGRVFATDARPGAAIEVLADLAWPVGAVAPDRDGHLIAAVDRGVARLTDGGVSAWLGMPFESAAHRLRVNDAVTDPHHRFWVGAMAWDATPGVGRLVTVHPDGTITAAVDGLTIPNGPAFSDDGRTMYLADSAKVTLFVFDVDHRSGELSRRRVFATLTDGSPDGMTVDSEGHLWVAVWGAACLHRYRPDGSLAERIPVPARQPTSVALTSEPPYAAVVTTATYGLDPRDEDGRTLVAPVRVGGRPTPHFG